MTLEQSSGFSFTSCNPGMCMERCLWKSEIHSFMHSPNLSWRPEWSIGLRALALLLQLEENITVLR